MGKSISLMMRCGIWAGVAGGIAEVLVISAYSAAIRASGADVARGITAAVGIDGLPPVSSVVVGIAVHMILAVMVGLALSFASGALWPDRLGGAGHAAVVAALVAIWTINFFVILPAISPAFVHIVPYPVSFLSKLMFGLAAAEVLRRAAAGGHDSGHRRPLFGRHASVLRSL